MFLVALYLPWCRYLSAQVGGEPRLYADNLKCVSGDHHLLLIAARFTTGYVQETVDIPQLQFIDKLGVARRDVHFVGDSGPGRKRIRLNRKNPAHLVGLNVHARPRVWKGLHFSGCTGVSGVDCKRRRCNEHGDDGSLVHPRTGVGWFLGLRRPTSPGLHGRNSLLAVRVMRSVHTHAFKGVPNNNDNYYYYNYNYKYYYYYFYNNNYYNNNYYNYNNHNNNNHYYYNYNKYNNNSNNNNTILGGSVLTSEEPPPHSGELKHALSHAGGPTQSQLSRPMSSGHHISMEHRLRRKQLNSDTNASNKTYLREIQKKKRRNFFFWKNEERKWKTFKNQKMKKWRKKEKKWKIKSKKKDKKREKKSRKKKEKRAQRGTPRDGPKNWFLKKNCQEKS